MSTNNSWKPESEAGNIDKLSFITFFN